MSRAMFAVALLCAAAVVLGQPTGKVVSVQVLHRHGDRSPIHIPPKYAAEWAATGLVAGQLSSYGHGQLQALGAHLRAAYVTQNGTAKLLPAQYRDGAVYARSTDVPRTLASVNTLLSTLYPGEGTLVPIHTLPTTEDRLLQPWGQCASYSISGPVARARVAERVSKEKSWLVDGLRKAFEWPETMANGTVLEQSLDNMLCMYAHDYTLPDFIIDNEEVLRPVCEEMVYALLGPNGPVEEDPRGPVAGELTRQILANMEADKQAPLTLYSAHDTTIVALTASLGILAPHQRKFLYPAYASSIKFELREQEDGKRTVHAYFGFPVATGEAKDSMHGWEYEYVPIDLKCPDTKAQCNLADFSAYIKKISPEFGTETYCCARTDSYYERQCNSYDTPFSKLTSDCQTFRKVCPAVACGAGQVLTHDRNCVPASGAAEENDDKALNTWRFVAVASIAINVVAFIIGYYLSRKLRAPQSHHVLIQDDLERGASQRA